MNHENHITLRVLVDFSTCISFPTVRVDAGKILARNAEAFAGSYERAAIQQPEGVDWGYPALEVRKAGRLVTFALAWLRPSDCAVQYNNAAGRARRVSNTVSSAMIAVDYDRWRWRNKMRENDQDCVHCLSINAWSS